MIARIITITTTAIIMFLFLLVSVRKHFESFESFVIQSGDLIREGHHQCGRRRTADVTTAANCDIRVTHDTVSIASRVSDHDHGAGLKPLSARGTGAFIAQTLLTVLTQNNSPSS